MKLISILLLTFVLLNGVKKSFSQPFTNIGSAIGSGNFDYFEYFFNWADFDNDGFLDFSNGSSNFKNSGIDSFIVSCKYGEVSTWYNSFEWFDYNNDNDFDIISTTPNGIIGGGHPQIVYQNNGVICFNQSIYCPILLDFGTIIVGDFDNEGDDDIILCGVVGFMSNESEVSINLRNEANGTFNAELNSSLPSRINSYSIGDYDNDGDKDFIISSQTGNFSFPSELKIYRNDGNFNFNSISNGFPQIGGNVNFIDIDNDADLDVFLCGTDYANKSIFKIYRNTNGNFTNINGINFGDFMPWFSSIGDYDNDGFSDLLLSGSSPIDTIGNTMDTTLILRNNGNGTFINSNTGFSTPSYIGYSTFADYDNDGDLDVLAKGILYRNDISTINLKPNPPSNLSSELSGDNMILKWHKATDDHTASRGLNYNLYVGKTPGGYDIRSPMADISTGFRRMPRIGNAEYDTTYVINVSNWPVGRYYWSVQAIDNCYLGSAFAPEQIFDKPYLFSGETDKNIYCGGQVQLLDTVINKIDTIPLSYSWQPTAGLSNSTMPNPIASPDFTTTYIVTASGGTFTGRDTIVVHVIPPLKNEICVVSVDTISWKNKVMWDKPAPSSISGFYIYKEVASNIYNWLGHVSYSNPATFIDYTSQPESHGDKYKITVVDSCGNESNRSFYHKTMNLVISSFGSTMGLSWDHYIDESGVFVPSKYYIYRGNSPSTMQLRDSISGSFTSYNDVNVFNIYYYMIGVEKNPPCDINGSQHSYSNVKDNSTLLGINYHTYGTITVSPNPFSDYTTINIPNYQPTTNNHQLVISDVTGKTVRTINLNETKPNTSIPYTLTINREDLKAGVYFVELSDDMVYRGKLIVE